MKDFCESRGSDRTEASLRCIVLGTVYVAAIAFAIAFSPQFGLVTLHPVGDNGKIAAAEAPTRVHSSR
ncbi:MAG: hypothetical protein ACM33T_11620 [Solirubrobacterales bacterium]